MYPSWLLSQAWLFEVAIAVEVVPVDVVAPVLVGVGVEPLVVAVVVGVVLDNIGSLGWVHRECRFGDQIMAAPMLPGYGAAKASWTASPRLSRRSTPATGSA